MNELYASISIGTAATLLAAILLLLRTKIQGQRPAIALARWWVAASTRTSCLVLAPLIAISVSCFAPISTTERYEPVGASAQGAHANTPSKQAAREPDEVPAAQEFEALKAYADGIDSNPQPAATASSAAASAALPDVDTMIAKLIARLEKQPEDANGWKMLGWSYLNTERPEEAVRAYETALKLQPGDTEIKMGLEKAKSAQTATAEVPASHPPASPAE